MNSTADTRLKAAGFEVYQLKVDWIPEKKKWLVTASFKCVCGTIEDLSDYYDEPPQNLNAAEWIEKSGAVSEKHLRNDGFSEIDIKRIRSVYDDYDKTIL